MTIVGVLRAGQGPRRVVEGRSRLKAAFPEVSVKIVGGGELAPPVMDVVASLGDTVEILGARSDVPEILAATDVVVQASQSEGLPTVMIEAGAAGRPVVATDVGGTRDIVLPDETGLLVAAVATPTGWRGESCSCSRARAKRTRDGSPRAWRRILATFSLDAQAETTAALYDRVVSAR